MTNMQRKEEKSCVLKYFGAGEGNWLIDLISIIINIYYDMYLLYYLGQIISQFWALFLKLINYLLVPIS